MKAPTREVHDASTIAARAPKVSPADAALVAAFLTPPSAWSLNLGLAYALIYPASRFESKEWLWVSAIVCGTLTVLAALVACGIFLRGMGGTPMPESARIHTRAVAAATCASSAFFLLAIVAQSIPLVGLGLHDR